MLLLLRLLHVLSVSLLRLLRFPRRRLQLRSRLSPQHRQIALLSPVCHNPVSPYPVSRSSISQKPKPLLPPLLQFMLPAQVTTSSAQRTAITVLSFSHITKGAQATKWLVHLLDLLMIAVWLARRPQTASGLTFTRHSIAATWSLRQVVVLGQPFPLAIRRTHLATLAVASLLATVHADVSLTRVFTPSACN